MRKGFKKGTRFVRKTTPGGYIGVGLKVARGDADGVAKFRRAGFKVTKRKVIGAAAAAGALGLAHLAIKRRAKKKRQLKRRRR